MIAIEMAVASRYDQNSYGILFISRYVYRITGRGVHNRSHPHRIKVWDNTGRPNADPGRISEFLGRAIGPGRYIGPDGRGTDDEASATTSAESVAITNSGTNTGTVASGQVYADDSLAIGDKVMLVLPGGRMPVSALLTVTASPLSDPILVPVS
jgi:hypothetical protein